MVLRHIHIRRFLAIESVSFVEEILAASIIRHLYLVIVGMWRERQGGRNNCLHSRNGRFGMTRLTHLAMLQYKEDD